jgi:hypothetical protein
MRRSKRIQEKHETKLPTIEEDEVHLQPPKKRRKIVQTQEEPIHSPVVLEDVSLPNIIEWMENSKQKKRQSEFTNKLCQIFKSTIFFDSLFERNHSSSLMLEPDQTQFSKKIANISGDLLGIVPNQIETTFEELRIHSNSKILSFLCKPFISLIKSTFPPGAPDHQDFFFGFDLIETFYFHSPGKTIDPKSVSAAVSRDLPKKLSQIRSKVPDAFLRKEEFKKLTWIYPWGTGRIWPIKLVFTDVSELLGIPFAKSPASALQKEQAQRRNELSIQSSFRSPEYVQGEFFDPV